MATQVKRKTIKGKKSTPPKAKRENFFSIPMNGVQTNPLKIGFDQGIDMPISKRSGGLADLIDFKNMRLFVDSAFVPNVSETGLHGAAKTWCRKALEAGVIKKPYVFVVRKDRVGNRDGVRIWRRE